MKLRHTAALVLVGWYLMIPPPVPGALTVPDVGAFLGDWFIKSAFDTAKECEDYHSRIMESTKKDLPRKNQLPKTPTAYVATAMLWSQCVASDDPRLKQHQPKTGP